MKESTTYQAIIGEGKAEGQVEALQRIVLRLGQQRFGKPSSRVSAAIHCITDLGRLDRMSDRLLSAADWHDLLETS